MEAALQEVINTFEPHRERALNRSMCRVEVVNRKTRNLTLPDGNVVQPGTSEIVCYEHNVKFIEDQVERDPAAVAAAARRFELRVAEQVQTALGSPHTQRSAEDMAEFLKGGKLTDRESEAHKRALATTGASEESEFQAIYRRGIKPLVSCKVLERDIPEPQRRMQVEESTRQASILATALRDAGVFAQAPQGNGNQGSQGQNRKQ